jgi:ferredoxin
MFPPAEHDVEACKAEHSGSCPHNSPRKTLPEHFFIDEDRCMRCGICEEVCPTDQPRYGNQKAIVLGTGHISLQSSVFDRNVNILDLQQLTFHSRDLGLELNTVMGSQPARSGLLINSPEARGLRLSGRNPFLLGLKIRALKLYGPVWLALRGKPVRPRDLDRAGA